MVRVAEWRHYWLCCATVAEMWRELAKWTMQCCFSVLGH